MIYVVTCVMTNYSVGHSLCVATTGASFGAISISDVGGTDVSMTCTDQVTVDTTFTLPSTQGTEGQILTVAAGGEATWTALPVSTTKAWVVSDYKPSGTPSGTFTAGSWVTRELNSIKSYSINDTSVQLAVAPANTNQLLIADGTYMITVYACAARVTRHKLRVQNVTDGLTEIEGTSEYCNQTDGQSYSRAIGILQVSGGPKVYSIEHYCFTTGLSDGFGVEAEDTTPTSTIGPTQQIGVSIVSFS